MKALKSRANEHFAVSSRTGNMLFRPMASSIRDHLLTCESRMDFNQFIVLDKHNDMLTLRISENIEIIDRKPTLNSDGSAFHYF